MTRTPDTPPIQPLHYSVTTFPAQGRIAYTNTKCQLVHVLRRTPRSAGCWTASLFLRLSPRSMAESSLKPFLGRLLCLRGRVSRRTGTGGGLRTPGHHGTFGVSRCLDAQLLGIYSVSNAAGGMRCRLKGLACGLAVPSHRWRRPSCVNRRRNWRQPVSGHKRCRWWWVGTAWGPSPHRGKPYGGVERKLF